MVPCIEAGMRVSALSADHKGNPKIAERLKALEMVAFFISAASNRALARQRGYCLHEEHLRIGDAKIPQFLILRGQAPRIDDGVAALAVVIARSATARCSAVGDLVSGPLLACDL